MPGLHAHAASYPTFRGMSYPATHPMMKREHSARHPPQSDGPTVIPVRADTHSSRIRQIAPIPPTHHPHRAATHRVIPNPHVPHPSHTSGSHRPRDGRRPGDRCSSVCRPRRDRHGRWDHADPVRCGRLGRHVVRRPLDRPGHRRCRHRPRRHRPRHLRDEERLGRLSVPSLCHQRLARATDPRASARPCTVGPRQTVPARRRAGS